MIGVVDAKSGNIGSIVNALNFLKINHSIIKNKNDIKKFKKIILPGVGAFKNLKKNLIDLDFYDYIDEFLNNDENFFLGICVGMQILLENGTEDGYERGFGIFPGKVINFNEIKKVKTPNINWLKLNVAKNSYLLSNYSEERFYFLHSYFCQLKDEEHTISSANYRDINFPSIINKNNIFGIQFHPEKSNKQGLNILKNFSTI